MLTAITVAATATSGRLEQSRDPDALAIMLAIGCMLPVAWRRTHPLVTMWTVVGCQIVFSSRDYAGAGWLGVMISLYSVAAHVGTPTRLRHGAAACGIAVGLHAVLAVAGLTPWGDIVATMVFFPSAYILGDNIRRRRERLADLAERAERAEREQELLARERVAEERTRIARELHDVVAHSLSVMVIQAAAARRQLTKSPERATEALLTIESQGRQAMNEMRRVLGVLRSDPSDAPELAPVPSLTDLSTLIAAVPDHRVSLAISGELEHLPPGVELSAYRVVQEALTNVRRHAGPGTTASVRVDRTTSELAVVVADDGRGASTLAAGTSDGFGLAGMRERVDACHGTLEAGPRPGGGWQVRAAFPLDAAPLGPDPEGVTP